MLKEFEQTREVNQAATDQIASDLYQTTSGILAERGVPKRRIAPAILAFLAHAGLYPDPNVLDYSELWNIRTVEKDCDFGPDGTRKVTVKGYGWDEKKTQPYRIFVSVSGASHRMELQKDHAVMWNASTRGKRTFNQRGDKVDIQEVKLYKQIISKLG